MKNRLYTDEETERIKLMVGSLRYYGEDWYKARSGRTTGLLFLYIGQAMTSPGKPVEIIDHEPSCGTRFDIHLVLKIRTFIKQHELKFFDITEGVSDRYFITYNIFEEE